MLVCLGPAVSGAGELEKLAGEIEGFVVYSRPPDPKREEVVWMIDRLERTGRGGLVPDLRSRLQRYHPGRF